MWHLSCLHTPGLREGCLALSRIMCCSSTFGTCLLPAACHCRASQSRGLFSTAELTECMGLQSPVLGGDSPAGLPVSQRSPHCVQARPRPFRVVPSRVTSRKQGSPPGHSLPGDSAHGASSRNPGGQALRVCSVPATAWHFPVLNPLPTASTCACTLAAS